jgi:capsule polysaccharide export protein KpsC/LpsZ
LWAERALRPDETRTIRDYLASRANGGMDWIKYNTGTRRDPDALRALYGLRADRPTYVLFTNVAWDAAVVFHHTAFRDMETWLLGTVHWFVEHPELQLIVRCHPAESHQLHESQQTAAHIIKSALPHLPAHIRVIAAEADVNSYDLTELAATTLVYTTKVGLEFATRNIPVIVAGEAFYRGKGFTYDPATETEYFELLRSGPPKPLDRQAEWALRYAHYYFFRRYMEVRGLKDSGIGQPVLALEIDHLSQLDAGVDRQMDVICDAILQGSLPLVDGF